MTDFIARHRAMVAAATPGPWSASDDDDDGYFGIYYHGDGIIHAVREVPAISPLAADAALVALDRNVIGALLDCAEALQAAERLAYGVPGAFEEDGEHVPDDKVSLTLRRDREAARSIRAALDALTVAYKEAFRE